MSIHSAEQATAQVINFAEAALQRARKSARMASREARSALLTHDFKFWTGASGRRYVHTIYSLIECPEVPCANIILVRRSQSGERDVLRICRAEHDAQSLNLADIRHTGAKLGANEVHIHLLAENRSQRGFIELDLAAAIDGTALSRSAHS